MLQVVKLLFAGENKLFVILSKLAQLIKFELALIWRKLHLLLFYAIGIVVCE